MTHKNHIAKVKEIRLFSDFCLNSAVIKIKNEQELESLEAMIKTIRSGEERHGHIKPEDNRFEILIEYLPNSPLDQEIDAEDTLSVDHVNALMDQDKERKKS